MPETTPEQDAYERGFRAGWEARGNQSSGGNLAGLPGPMPHGCRVCGLDLAHARLCLSAPELPIVPEDNMSNPELHQTTLRWSSLILIVMDLRLIAYQLDQPEIATSQPTCQPSPAPSHDQPLE